MSPRVPPGIRPHAILATVLAASFGFAAPSSAQTITWSRWPMPYPRYDHVAVYDPTRDRMVVFGGHTLGPDGDSGETWVLRFDGPPRWEWGGVTPPGPLARAGAGAVYDLPGDRMVMFGGEIDGGPLGDTWRLSLATRTWGNTGFTGSAPSARVWHAAVFDGVRRHMLVFGGWYKPADVLYRLDLATQVWSAVSTPGTPPPLQTQELYRYPAAHDVLRDRLIVLHSTGTWQLTLTGTPTWSQLVTSGTPPPDAQGDLFFDAPRDRMLQVRGGGSVWALSMDATPTWTSIANAPLPPGLHDARIAHDPARDRLIWFGSSSANDTWAFALATATWSLVEPGSPIPIRSRPTAVAARPWDALVVFGGASNTTWRLPLNGVGDFEQVTTAGTVPSARSGHAAIYDPVRQRMIVFGGNDGFLRNDVRSLTIGPTPTWSAIAPTGTPPPGRESSHAIYDPIRDRMVVFGGYAGSTYFRGAWALALGGTPAWTELAPDAALPQTSYNYVVYDSRRDRLIAIGADVFQTHAWWMPAGGPATWTEFGSAMDALTEFAADYDSVGDRVLLYGGLRASGTDPRLELWQMNPTSGQWSTLSPVPVDAPWPLQRFSHTLTRDPYRERFVLYGGLEGQFAYSAWRSPAVWFASSSYTVDVEPTADAAGVTLAFRRLWLAAPDRIAFELKGLGEGGAVVEVFDVAGRRLGAAALSPGGAGSRSGSVTLGTPAPAGVVFVRVRQAAARSAIRRLAVLR
jgi:hypothetical protein